jgi:hypothetical protein
MFGNFGLLPNMNILLTVILPSIRPETWPTIMQQIRQSCHPHNFEVIAIGPNHPLVGTLQRDLAFRYIQDFGSPSRSVQIASTLANGKYVAWIPDDCIVEPYVFGKCIDLMETKTEKDGMTLLYSEGIGFAGEQHNDPSYWVARTHAGLRFPQVKVEWKIAPCFMHNLNYFRKLGGLDCRFEHVNMNAHDFAFRLQRDGGVIYSSPERVMRLNWIPWGQTNKSPIQIAYEENDEPLFRQIFSSDEERPIVIDYDNWRLAEPFWKRKYVQ